MNSKQLANSSLSWTTTPMTEVTTGNMITVLDLIKKGKPVIIHTFAVWCPACTNQLKETTKLVRNNPDNYTVLAIDIDPNENSATVLNSALFDTSFWKKAGV